MAESVRRYPFTFIGPIEMLVEGPKVVVFAAAPADPEIARSNRALTVTGTTKRLNMDTPGFH
jgi:hypothetical protein